MAKMIQIIVLWLIIAGLMLNLDWVVDYAFEPFMFVSVIVILVKIAKREK